MAKEAEAQKEGEVEGRMAGGGEQEKEKKEEKEGKEGMAEQQGGRGLRERIVLITHFNVFMYATCYWIQSGTLPVCLWVFVCVFVDCGGCLWRCLWGCLWLFVHNWPLT